MRQGIKAAALAGIGALLLAGCGSTASSNEAKGGDKFLLHGDLTMARAELKQNPAVMPDLSAALANRPKPRQFVPPPAKPVERKVAAALPEAPKVASNLRSDRARSVGLRSGACRTTSTNRRSA